MIIAQLLTLPPGRVRGLRSVGKSFVVRLILKFLSVIISITVVTLLAPMHCRQKQYAIGVWERRKSDKCLSSAPCSYYTITLPTILGEVRQL